MKPRGKTILLFGVAPLLFAVGAGFALDGFSQEVISNPQPPETHQNLDPAAWGSDHIGKPLPEFVSGDECLFCHRLDIAPAWGKNPHQLTIRAVTSESPAIAALKISQATQRIADDVEFLLGSKDRTRYLQRTEKYGTLALLTTGWQPSDKNQTGQLVDTNNPSWDADKFGNSCVGCHTTTVDTKTRAFSSVSLDCSTCHGNVPLEHSRDATKAILSPHRADSPRVIASICGQCHIRTGQSQSTQLPYANQFVAGDNLFRDLKVDWTEEHLATLNPADRHVLENLRDVVVHGKDDMTCLTCHDVHPHSSEKHQEVHESAICANCHVADDFTQKKQYDVHSRTCEY